jgi:hypothetical protein
VRAFVFCFPIGIFPFFCHASNQTLHPPCFSPLCHQPQNVTRVAVNLSIDVEGWAKLLPSLAALTTLQVLRLYSKCLRWSKSGLGFRWFGVWVKHTSHVTHHTSHVTRHTSHVTHHISHVTFHASRCTHHTSRITLQSSCVARGF